MQSPQLGLGFSLLPARGSNPLADSGGCPWRAARPASVMGSRVACGVAIASPQNGLWDVGKKATMALRTHEKCLDVSAGKLAPEFVPTTGFQDPRDLGTALTGSISRSSLRSLPPEGTVMKQH